MIPAIRAAVLLVLLAPAQQKFTQFTYCRANATGAFESFCIQLDPTGAGQAIFKRRDDDEVKLPMTLSPAGSKQFLAVLSGTNNLAKAASYESKKKVADLGMKHLILEMASERREARFNYSDMKEVTALVTFFENLVTQQVVAADLIWAMQYDRLGIPERLDQLESMLKEGRLADPKSMLDLMDAIDRDQRIVNYARTHARELKARIAAGK